LKNYISKTSIFKEIENRYTDKNEVRLISTNDDVNLVILSALFGNKTENVLIVTPNLFSAQKVYEKLVMQFDESRVAFFPQDEFITTEMLAMSDEFKLERILTVNKIMGGKPLFVVTNTTGYVKKLMPLKRWRQATVSLTLREHFSQKTLLSKLVSMGYKREETVENPGEFSFRGGLLDIFPINLQHGVRVEFFDDEIESIRLFDIPTQRSIKKIKNLIIFPYYEFFYDERDFEVIKKNVENKLQLSKFDDESIKRINNELENLEQHNDIDRLSRYQTFLPYKTEGIMDYLKNENVVFWDYKKVQENYEDVLRDISDWYNSSVDYPKLDFDLLFDINHIYSGKSLYIDKFSDYLPQAKSIRVRAKEATLYSNNIHMLINDLKKYEKHLTTIITFASSKNLHHFIELIEDKVTYKIIGEKDSVFLKTLNLVVAKNELSFELMDGNLIVLNENNLFSQKQHKHPKYKSTIKDTKKISTIEELKKGDYIVHYEHGIGRFLGVKQMTVGNMTNDYIHIAYKGDDTLFIPVENINLIWKYIGSEGVKPKIHRLGSADWAKTKLRVRKKVRDIADKLIKLYAAREKAKGFAFSKNSDLHQQFADDFTYELTKDQQKAIMEISHDMELDLPMDRLLCGDVGYGKTEVAMRAAFKAVYDNKQVAYLAPTTLLTRQHFYTFKQRFEKYGIKVALLNRFVTKAVQNQVLRDVISGDIDIVIGTHRLLSKDMVFADLGLLIIDEEQRFGVEHKERIKELKVNVDVLSLSATPIPRTLQMAIMGVKSMSLLETPPLNRYPIQTYVLERNDAIIRDAVQREMARNGQIFYLYNKVDDISVVAQNISRLVPEARVVYAHGKMGRLKMEEVIQDFLDGEYDVLVSTTIIETGIDIPNANTLLIHDSDRLGLAQLYQIRGRVGRSDKIAFAYLMYKKNKQLTEEAVKRLKVIKEFTELGSGFKIAMRDLSIRGAGDVLGTEQSGFIDTVGLDLYLEMLKEEVEIQQTGKKPDSTLKPETPLKLKVNKYIDSNYIENDYVKMEIHRKISRITSKEDIQLLKEEFKDRFGEPTEELILYMYEKLFEHLAKQKGLEKIRELKNHITFRFSKEASMNIDGEYLFSKANEISRYIRFQYKNNQLDVILDTIKLQRNYLYIIVDLLEIMKTINGYE
jgi:transcription-repair coupling factor (superfamily II helicase)